MSQNETEDSFLEDEDSSYKMLMETKANMEIDLVIDESRNESYLSSSSRTESPTNDLSSQNQTSVRYSEVFIAKKKPPRPLESDSDSDVQNTVHDGPTSKLKIRNNKKQPSPLESDSDSDVQNTVDVDDISASRMEIQNYRKQPSPLESDSDSDVQNTVDDVSASRLEIQNYKKQPSPLESDSDSDVQDSVDDISASRLGIQNYRKQPSPLESDSDSDVQDSVDDILASRLGIRNYRKQPSPLESDSDSDVQDSVDDISASRLGIQNYRKQPTTLESDSDSDVQNTVDDASVSTLEIQNYKKQPSPLESDSDSDVQNILDDISASRLEVQIDKEKGCSSISNPKSHNNESRKKRVKDISKNSANNESECSGESQVSIDISSESRLQNNKAAPTTEQIDDVFNFSAKMKNARISEQFMLNSEGILNSTPLHTEESTQQKWRPSERGDIPEISAEEGVEAVDDNSSDVIEVSSGEEFLSPSKTPRKLPKPKSSARQQTLHPFISVTAPTPSWKQETSQKTAVSKAQYEAQLSRINSLKVEFAKLQNLAENLDFDALPDKGQLIKERLRTVEHKFMEEQERLQTMIVSEQEDNVSKDQVPGAFKDVAWEDLQAGANAVLPKTFGRQALSTYNAQKAVTLDRLQQLHGALQTCPKEDDMEDDPAGLTVPLMPHQRRALAWLGFREKAKPSGGILADDMGLGKTLTMIALIVKSMELEKTSKDSDEENQDRNEFVGKHVKFDGGSLIVCPASLINQWSGEIDIRLKRGLLGYNLYHGAKRESSAKRLAEYDVVITTYSIVNNESDKKSPLNRIKWRRIILDEAHQIRNYKAQTSEACCQLLAKSRWALTGTPMHNKELDMYALLKFLRCTPFDDLQVWKRWVGDKSSGGQERLHTVISSLMLRRTKAELQEKGGLKDIPDKKWLLVKVELDKNELQVYHKVLIFSQTLFAQFLHQRAEKNQDYMNHKFGDLPNNAPNQEYFKMRQKLLKLNKVKNVSQHEILVLLLRLRQICCHPSLITAMLDERLEDVGEDDEECEELNILEQLQKLNIEEDEGDEDEYKPSKEPQGIINESEKVNLKEATRGHLRASDPIFAKERASSKIKYLLKILDEKVLANDDKAIIVSQWSSYLNLIALHLKEYNVKFDQLDGKVPVHKRMEMVNRLNDARDPMKVLLLSLTAGGVGLNLVGANHLFLLDLHWNPQLENQAQDRIYRVGQTKPVFVYKFMAVDTIEERIKMLQEKKLALAEGILTGTRQVVQNKLSLDDLKMIFGM